MAQYVDRISIELRGRKIDQRIEEWSLEASAEANAIFGMGQNPFAEGFQRKKVAVKSSANANQMPDDAPSFMDLLLSGEEFAILITRNKGAKSIRLGGTIITSVKPSWKNGEAKEAIEMMHTTVEYL